MFAMVLSALAARSPPMAPSASMMAAPAARRFLRRRFGQAGEMSAAGCRRGAGIPGGRRPTARRDRRIIPGPAGRRRLAKRLVVGQERDINHRRRRGCGAARRRPPGDAGGICFQARSAASCGRRRRRCSREGWSPRVSSLRAASRSGIASRARSAGPHVGGGGRRDRVEEVQVGFFERRAGSRPAAVRRPGIRAVDDQLARQDSRRRSSGTASLPREMRRAKPWHRADRSR